MKIFKKSLAMILSLIMVFSIIPASVLTASAASTSPIEGATGAGTLDDPVIVDTYEEFLASVKGGYATKVVADIEIPESLYIYEDEFVSLIIDGSLNFVNENTCLVVWGGTLHIYGTGSVNTVKHCVSVLDGTFYVRENVLFESEKGENVVLFYAGYMRVDAGVFKSNNTSPETRSLYIKAAVQLNGGSFPNGISRANSSYGAVANLQSSNGVVLYQDGFTTNPIIRYDEPITVYNLKFDEQYPKMPSGTSYDLGSYSVGSTAEELTFSFSFNDLPTEFIDAGCFVEEELSVYSEKLDKVIHTQNNGDAYRVPVNNSDKYTITEIITLKDSDGNIITTNTNTFDVAIVNVFQVSGTVSGVDSNDKVQIELYKSGETTPFMTTLMNSDFMYSFEKVPAGTAYTIKATSKNCVDYTNSFNVDASDITFNIGMKKLYTITLNISGVLNSDTSVAYTFENDSQTIKSGTIKGNGKITIPNVVVGRYNVVVSASGYDSYRKEIIVPSTTTINAEMKYKADYIDYGFETQSPEVSALDKSYKKTELGVVFTAPTFSFTEKELPAEVKLAGYKTIAQTKIWHNETAYEVIDSTSWTCGVYDYGTKKIEQIITLYYPDGTVAGTKTHTYTYTYLPLKFNTHTPSVSAEEATAGVSNLGTLTKAQTFNFSAIPLDFTLTEEGYFLKLKTEAYQGDKLVYSAFSGDNYIHIYQGEGKVVQTIYMFDSNNTVVGSISHTYNFTMEFPDGTITLSSDYLTLTENSTYQLLATIVPEELASTLVWSSDNEDIATVSSNGTITAVRAGSAIIKAELGNGAVAYCPVLITASDVKAYVGGVGLAEGEYLVQGSNVPRTTKPADNYAYLATVDGVLTLTLHNYSYSGAGAFASKTAAYSIYSTSAIKIVAEGKNKIGPMSAPVERYTSYGIGGSESVSISSDSSSTLTIDGVSTGISSTRYVTVAGNLDIINASSGINATHGQSMGSITFSSGKVNINCTGTAITITGNAINFTGAKVNINCKNGINLVRQGAIYVTNGSLAITASASGINLKSGQSMQVDGGSVFVDAVNHGIQHEGELIVNGGTMAVKSSDTANDSSYAALYGSGTVSLGSSMSATASTEYAGSSTVSFNSADMNTYDYVLFSGTTHEFVRQPVGGTVAKDKLLNVKWEAGFTPLKIELVIYDTTEFRVVELNKLAKSTSLSALPDGGYYQLRAYYTSSYYVVSDRFYITTKTHTVVFYTGSNVLKSQQVKDGETATTPGVMLANGKYFVGWATESGEMFSLSTPITSDISLYAVWSLVQVDGVAMGEGTYLAPGALSTTTERPEGGCAYYEDGVLMLYNYHSDSWGIYFGEMDLVIYSLGESNSVNCIVGYGADSSLTIDGNAKMNIGHAQWMDKAIVVGDTITFRTDTEVECVDAIAIYGAEKIIVDNCDVRVSAYMDMGYPAGIYGNEAAIYVLGSGSLYVRCDDYYVLTDAYIAEPDKVTVSANENRDGIFTADDIITDVDEPYDLENYNQMLITHKHSFNTVITVPTCQHSGIKEHYMCFCGKIYADAEGTQEITDYEAWKNGEGKLETLDHNWIKLDGECIYGCGTIAFEAANGAVLDKENRYIFGLDAGIKSLDNHTNVLVEGLEWTYELGQFGGFGTGTKAILVNDDDLVAEYTLLIYGDVDGDGWYDGEDAFLVNCIVAGMLTKDDLPDYMWMAADCNHDGVIDQKDADLLIGAGVRLNDIDQHADQTELSTQSAYMEYVALIDQSASIDVESDEDKNEQDKEDTEDVTIPDTNEDGVSDGSDESDGTTEKFDIVVVIMNIFDFIKNLLSWVFSFIIG